MHFVMDRANGAAENRESASKSMSQSVWEVEVDRVTVAEWSRVLGLFEDANIYQTAAYGGVRWGEKNLSRIVLKRDGQIVAAAQLRIVKPTPLKFGMAYLRWGPLFARHGRPVDAEVAARIARAVEAEYAGNRRLFLRVLPNAFAGSPRAQLFQSSFGPYMAEPLCPVNTYRTFALDLGPTLEDLRKGFDKKWRNQLTRSEKNGLTVISGSGLDEYRTFCKMYDQMRSRKTFETSVDVEEFERIQAALPEQQRMRVLIAEEKSVPVAGVVASAMGDSAIYLLGATSDAGLQSKGAYLLHWTLIQWLKANRVRWYDLGGIDPVVNPGVYHFKRGFSGADVTQLSPLVACRSTFSSAMVKAGMAMQRALRGSRSSAPAKLADKPAETPETA